MKLIKPTVILGAISVALAALNPGPSFTRLNKDDAVIHPVFIHLING